MSDTPDPARPYMRHYFHNMVQQSQTTMMGMWLFMVQEILFFGGLFGCYTWYRITYPVAYAAGAGSMDVFWGGLNTVVLISSSVTIVFAVHSTREWRCACT
jgi:cytochrome c oxidase subunit 3